MAACEKIKKSGKAPIYEAVSDGWHQVLWFPEIGPRIEQLNPGLAQKLNRNEIKFTDVPDAVKALEQLQAIAKAGYFEENYMTNAVADGLEALATEKCAMMIETQNFFGSMKKNYTDVDVGNFGMFDIPILDNKVLNINPSANSRLIYSKSKNIEAAKKYIDYITAPENLQNLIDNDVNTLALPYEGLKSKYTPEIQAYFDSHKDRGIVYQTDITYVNPQWSDMGKDIAAMFIGSIKPIDILKNIDKRREEQAKAAKDPNWK